MLKKKRSKQIDYEEYDEEYEEEYNEDRYERDEVYDEYDSAQSLEYSEDAYEDTEDDESYSNEQEEEYEDAPTDIYEQYEEEYEEYTPPIKKSKQTKKQKKQSLQQKKKTSKTQPTRSKEIDKTIKTTRKTNKVQHSNPIVQNKAKKQERPQSPETTRTITATNNVVIDVDLPDTVQKTFISSKLIQEYKDRKFKKVANQSHMTLEIYDEQKTYSPVASRDTTSIEIDFHEKAFDITALALLDIKNNIKQETKPKEVKMDIEDYKEEVLNKANSSDFNEKDYDEFFNDTDQYDPDLSETITPFEVVEETPIDIDSDLKLEDDDFNFMENFNSVLEENIEFDMSDPDEMLIFGLEEEETFTSKAPTQSTSKTQKDNTVRAGINTADALLQQVSGEEF